MGDAPLKGVSHFVLVHSLYLFPCGTNLFLKFAGHAAKRCASDRSRQVRSFNRVDSGPPDHHKDTCTNHGISGILQSRFNCIIRETQRDTWIHQTGER